MTPAYPEPLHPAARELPPPAARWRRIRRSSAGTTGRNTIPIAWPQKVKRRYALIPTICFNCEAACGLLAYVDQDTLQIQKFEGNPVHPGSRGRNCAKGPATLNQVEDPERILYPLRRTGPRGGGQWERVTWDEVLDDIGGRIRKALVEGRQKEVMYHLGRPGHELVYLQRVFHAWGIDGHNSHTNVCSASARAGYAFWHGMDRPSPDHANARFILLLSSHLETGHYFNPHAQRIIEAKMRGAKVAVIDSRLCPTRPRWPTTGWRRGRAPRPRCCWPWPTCSSASTATTASSCGAGSTGRSTCARSGPTCRSPSTPSTRRSTSCTRRTRRSSPRRRAASIPPRSSHIARAIGRRRLRAGHAHLAQHRRRQPRRLAGGARAGVARGPGRRRRHAGRHRAQRLEQGDPGAADDAAAGQGVERAAHAEGVPAGLLRDELPAAALPARGPRQARHVLHAGLQPRVDESRRHVVDRDADRRGQGGAARVPHAGVERDGVVRATTCCPWATPPSATT